MSRFAVICALLLPLFSVAAEPAPRGAYPAVDVPMQLERVSQHVYFVQGEAGVTTDNEGFISNAGAVVTDEGVMVCSCSKNRVPKCGRHEVH